MGKYVTSNGVHVEIDKRMAEKFTFGHGVKYAIDCMEELLTPDQKRAARIWLDEVIEDWALQEKDEDTLSPPQRLDLSKVR